MASFPKPDSVQTEQRPLDRDGKQHSMSLSVDRLSQDSEYIHSAKLGRDYADAVDDSIIASEHTLKEPLQSAPQETLMQTLSVVSQPSDQDAKLRKFKKTRESLQPQVQTIVVPVMAPSSKNAPQSKTLINKLQQQTQLLDKRASKTKQFPAAQSF